MVRKPTYEELEQRVKELEEEAIKQLTNVAMLPGIVTPACAMPDAHFGY